MHAASITVRTRFAEPTSRRAPIPSIDLRLAAVTSLLALAVAAAIAYLFLAGTHEAIRASSRPDSSLNMLPLAWFIAAVLLALPVAVAGASLILSGVIALIDKPSKVWHHICAAQPIIVLSAVRISILFAVGAVLLVVVKLIIALIVVLLILLLLFLMR